MWGQGVYRLKAKPMSLEVDKRKLAQMKPFDVPFHIRPVYKKEILDMIEAGIIVPL